MATLQTFQGKFLEKSESFRVYLQNSGILGHLGVENGENLRILMQGCPAGVVVTDGSDSWFMDATMLQHSERPRGFKPQIYLVENGGVAACHHIFYKIRLNNFVLYSGFSTFARQERPYFPTLYIIWHGI